MSPRDLQECTQAVPIWKALLDGLPDAMWLVDVHSLCIVLANDAASQLFGLPREELQGRPAADFSASAEDMVFWQEAAAGNAEELVSDSQIAHASGALVPVTRRVKRVAPDGLPEQAVYLVMFQDLSARRAAQHELEDRLAELRATLESTADGILVTDLQGAIRGFNRKFSALWGLPEELLTRRDDAAVHAWMRDNVVDAFDYAQRLSAIQDDTLLQTSDVFTLTNGKVVERVTLPQSSRGQAIGRVYSFRDITEKLAARQRIEELSHTDELTGLPNRRLLADRVAFALAMAHRYNHPFALMVVNLDRFKHINETFGLEFGDRVLLEATQRLKSSLRSVDTVARLGSDEFVLLVHQADAAGAQATARRVIEAMSRPFNFEEAAFTVTCSIGIAMGPVDGDRLDELMRRADAAMHRVKDLGRASFRFHQPHRDVAQRSQMQIDHAMRQALASGAFRLHYQPQIDLSTGKAIGVEALLRWRDPVLGDVSPSEFIPLAEESGFIIPIGDWVLAEAVGQAARWRAAGLHLPVSINVSALQFQQADFVERVKSALYAAGLPPQMLELELTESILIHDAEGALMRLQALEQLGVGMAIDDFGTGYSSLGYLKRFPINRLKIDRSFVKSLPGDASDVAIVGAIIHLASALNLKVIAEGVETEAQRDFLVGAGCHEFQGFLCSPAVDVGSLEALLQAL